MATHAAHRGRIPSAAALLAVLLAVAAASPALSGDLDRVRIDFYGEAGCPFCKDFTIKRLLPLLSNGVSGIVAIRYVPWGNARYNHSDDTYSCQHGPLECEYNKLLGCAIHEHPAQEQWLPYAACISKDAREEQDYLKLSKTCAKQAGLPHDGILECYKGPLGLSLQLEARDETDALQPRHLGVPWVLVNGLPLFDNTDLVQAFACAAYNGPRPAACFADPGPSQAWAEHQRSMPGGSEELLDGGDDIDVQWGAVQEAGYGSGGGAAAAA